MGPAEQRWDRARAGWHAAAAAEKVGPASISTGEPTQIVYTPRDVAGDALERIGFPGQHPFTRGVYPTMYRGRVWTARQYAGFGTAGESNARYKFLLAHGQPGLSVAFDLPTQLGFDSDHRNARYEVGRVGVAISSLQDMEEVFDGIPLDQVSVSFTINAVAAVILAMFVAVAEKQGVRPERLRGTLQNDILKEYIARGAWIFPVEPSLRLITDTIEFCARQLPRVHPISVVGGHMREAGARNVEEVAYTLSNAIIYVERALSRGLAVDEFAPQLSFGLLADMDIFETAAKCRAARRLWARIMTERFGARDPRSQMFRFYTACNARGLSHRYPLNNIARVALMGLGPVLGGVQAMTLAAFDEAYAIPSEESALVSLHTQHILACESGVTKTADPLAGSYYVEYLTDHLEREIEKVMRDIEARGGMAKLVQDGTIQREVTRAAYEEEEAFRTGRRVMVGVNRFTAEGHPAPAVAVHRHDPTTRERQCARLRVLRAQRDDGRVGAALEQLRAGARRDANLMPRLIEAVKAYATMGEIVGVLREEFGTFKEPAL